MSTLLKTAQRVRALRNVQQGMVVSGDHRSAWRIGPDVFRHMDKVARLYLGSTDPVGTPAGRLVREIACEAALADPARGHVELRRLLRRANRVGGREWVLRLRRARRRLPDLDRVARRLRGAPAVEGIVDKKERPRRSRRPR